jgi:hypothetical protein
VAALAQRVAATVPTRDPLTAAWLVDTLLQVGEKQQVPVLAERSVATIAVHQPDLLAMLMDTLREAGAQEQVAVLASRVASMAKIDYASAGEISMILESMRRANTQKQFTDLATRAASTISVNQVGFSRPEVSATGGVGRLLETLRWADAREQVATFATRVAATILADNPSDVAWLLDTFTRVGAYEQIAVLATRGAATASLDNPYAVAWLLDALQEVGAQEQIAVLGTRVATDTNITFDDQSDALKLINELRRAGTQEELDAFSAHANQYATMDFPYSVFKLDSVLVKARIQNNSTIVNSESLLNFVKEIDDRWKSGGMRQSFSIDASGIRRTPLSQDWANAVSTESRFGRDPNGDSAPAWSWDDLD